MLHRLFHRFNRPLAVIQLAAMVVWALGSAVWAYAPISATCPMEAAMQAQVDTSKSCCSGPETASDAGQPIKQPASHCPGGDAGKKCCCPAVAPALLHVALPMLPPVRGDYTLIFDEPLMHDALALNELVIPPSV